VCGKDANPLFEDKKKHYDLVKTQRLKIKFLNGFDKNCIPSDVGAAVEYLIINFILWQ